MDAEPREHFIAMGVEILAAVEQLERVVSPGVFDQVVHLTTLVDDHASGRVQAECDHPGIAPAWWVIYAHLDDGTVPPCGTHARGCTLPPLEEPV